MGKMDYCGAKPDMSQVDRDIPSELGEKFGYTIWSNGLGQYLDNNQVFSREDLPSLLCELQTLARRGAPLAVKKELLVLPNSWWGVKGGYTATILFVLNEKCPEFEKKLPDETRQTFKHGSFAEFPFLD